MNSNMLKAQMIMSGITPRVLSEKLGINASTYYKKLRGDSEFTQSEICEIKHILSLSNDLVCSIFFASPVS